MRWTELSTDELLNIIFPSNVLDDVQLLKLMKESNKQKNATYRIPCKFLLCLGDQYCHIRILINKNKINFFRLGSEQEIEENFATTKYGAKVISGKNPSALLSGNFVDYDVNKGNI